MAFVKEKVSEENVERFKLNELWNEYNQGAFIRLPDRCFEHYWIIDKERGIWLYEATIDKDNFFQTVFIFNYKNKNVEIRVKTSDKGSQRPSDNPYIKIWDFISLNPKSIEELNSKDIKEILKEALVVYVSSRFRDSINKKIIVKYNW